MNENKYTDEEVIKALDHCRNGERGSKCSKCEYVTGCKHWLLGLALDLINRQKAEISALTSAVDNSTQVFLKLHDEYQEQKAEIERLNAEKDTLIKTYKECMVESIKEFAEKLKEKAYVNKPYGVGKSVDECDIDALVKEMTEI